MSLPDVSITSVLFNSATTVERYAAPLKELVASGFAEVIAVDNASPDDSAARLKNELPGARILTAPGNLGFAGGCNLGWSHARGRYWLLLNPDVEPTAAGIRRLVQWMDGHPTIALVSPLLREEDGSMASVARSFPSFRWTLGEILRLHKLIGANTRSERLLGAYWTGEPREVDWVPFAAAMIRRDAVEQVGGLSDRLFMYGEDIELCWRLRQAGCRVAICGDTTFLHSSATSAKATWDEVERGERLAAGIAAALRIMHGRMWTRLYATLSALALFLDSIDPRRGALRRRSTRLGARAWLRQAVRESS